MSARICHYCQQPDEDGRPVKKIGEHHSASAAGLDIYAHDDCPRPERKLGNGRAALEEAAARRIRRRDTGG